MRSMVLMILLASSWAVDVQTGDFIFQSFPQGELIDAIETATASPISHCGIVVMENAKIRVLEAVGPVKFTDYQTWIHRGREGKYQIVRLKDQAAIPVMIEAAKSFIGKPYDMHYDLDDEKIYCSELIYKAFLAATKKEIAKPKKLGDLNWKPIERTIRNIEEGGLPLDRLMVTPIDVASSEFCVLVYTDFKDSPSQKAPPTP